MKNKQNQQGQILLVVVLLLATTLTIVMTVIFTSRTETQISKLQQDADRSLVAAEAGIEAAIKNQQPGVTEYRFDDLALQSLEGIDLESSKVIIDTTSANFISPVIQKDQQYTVYLSVYENGAFGPSLVSGDFNLFYGTDGANCDDIALEVSFLTVSAGQNPAYGLQREVADTGSILGSSVGDSFILPHDIDGTQFECGKTLAVPADAKLLFTRVLGPAASTRLGIDSVSFPAQGKTYSSEARTNTGVTKKIKVFQSFPQIPAELFVTSYNDSVTVD